MRPSHYFTHLKGDAMAYHDPNRSHLDTRSEGRIARDRKASDGAVFGAIIRGIVWVACALLLATVIW